MAVRITDALVRGLEPPARSNRIFYDDEVKGFGVRITAAGAVSFVVNYRASGRERRMTIGRYPDWSVAAARIEAKAVKREVSLGFDPMGEREADRAMPTVAELAERYLAEYAVLKSASSQRNERSMLEQRVLPRIGKMKVDAVSYSDIDALHREISQDRPVRANRVIQCLSKMFNLAIRWEYRTDNPVKGVRKNPEEPRERYLSSDELARLLAALDEYTDNVSANVVRFLLLTGARRGEAMRATWDQFDLDQGVWTKPSSHTKQKRTHRAPLSSAALDLLRSIKATSTGPFVFPGAVEGQPIQDIKKFWAIMREKAELGDLRIHDLRHSYASMLASSGQSLPVIGALLGHTQVQTTARYAHLFDDPLRAATESVVTHIKSRIEKAGP